MNTGKTYKTRQRAEIEGVLRDGDCMTVRDICARLASSGANVGETTVYRTLEKMAAEGDVRRYDPGKGAAVYRLAQLTDGDGGGSQQQHGQPHAQAEEVGKIEGQAGRETQPDPRQGQAAAQQSAGQPLPAEGLFCLTRSQLHSTIIPIFERFGKRIPRLPLFP